MKETHAIENSDKIAAYQQLALTYEKYISILTLELNGMAAVHGWKSHRVEIGQAMREMIEMCKKEAGFDTSFMLQSSDNQCTK